MKAAILTITCLACILCHADQARVFVQWIQLPHSDLTKIVSNANTAGSLQHTEVMPLVAQGKAKILDTNIVVTCNRHNANLDAVTEVIFPFSNQPPQIPSPYSPNVPVNPMERIITCFDTRDTGVTLHVGGWVKLDPKTVSLRIAPQRVSLLRLISMYDHVDAWGDASLRMPILEAWKVDTQLILTHGRYELAGIIRPETQPPAPAVENRILVFVRADLLSVGNEP
jgi:hypothetical protein